MGVEGSGGLGLRLLGGLGLYVSIESQSMFSTFRLRSFGPLGVLGEGFWVLAFGFVFWV